MQDFTLYTFFQIRILFVFIYVLDEPYCHDEDEFVCNKGFDTSDKQCKDITAELSEEWCSTESLGFAHACCSCK